MAALCSIQQSYHGDAMRAANDLPPCLCTKRKNTSIVCTAINLAYSIFAWSLCKMHVQRSNTYTDTDHLLQKGTPWGEKNIQYIRKFYPKCIIIAGGGIQSMKDIEEYKKAGANYFSVSSIFFHPFKTLSFFSDIYF